MHSTPKRARQAFLQEKRIPTYGKLRREVNKAYAEWLKTRGLPPDEPRGGYLDFKSKANPDNLNLANAPLSEPEIERVYWDHNIKTLR